MSRVVIGLGNPGRQYAGTRHNVGFDVVNTLATRVKTEWASAPRGIEALMARTADVVLVKPLTFMNLSGAAVTGLMQFYKTPVADMVVIVDDVYLELGRLRIRSSGSAGGHNGLKSIIGSLGTEEFARIRMGVGRGDARRDLGDHVLSKFDAAERADVEALIGRAADAAQLFVTDGIGPVMNRYNRKEDAE